jgi:hypothetical protein
MTSKADFTAAEWELLTDLPRLAAFGAMAADEGDAVSATRELWAGMMELTQAARNRYLNTPLIQEVAQAVAQDEEGADVSRFGWQPSAEPLGAAVVEQALATAAAVRQVLASGAPVEEAAAYTDWVLGIARASAEATRTGLFGVGGKRVTDREAAFMCDLAAAMGTS